MVPSDGSPMGVVKILIEVRRGEKRAVGIDRTRRRSDGSGHRHLTPTGMTPPLVDDEGLEGCESRERQESRVDNEEDLRCVFGSTAPPDAPTAAHPGACRG